MYGCYEHWHSEREREEKRREEKRRGEKRREEKRREKGDTMYRVTSAECRVRVEEDERGRKEETLARNKLQLPESSNSVRLNTRKLKLELSPLHDSTLLVRATTAAAAAAPAAEVTRILTLVFAECSLHSSLCRVSSRRRNCAQSVLSQQAKTSEPAEPAHALSSPPPPPHRLFPIEHNW